MNDLQQTVTTNKEALFSLECELAGTQAHLTTFCELLEEICEQAQPLEVQSRCASLLWAIRQQAEGLEQISHAIHIIRAGGKV